MKSIHDTDGPAQAEILDYIVSINETHVNNRINKPQTANAGFQPPAPNRRPGHRRRGCAPPNVVAPGDRRRPNEDLRRGRCTYQA